MRLVLTIAIALLVGETAKILVEGLINSAEGSISLLGFTMALGCGVVVLILLLFAAGTLRKDLVERGRQKLHRSSDANQDTV